MRFARAGAAHDDLAAFELVAIEGVGGLADFVEHVVAGVGHVADAALVDEFEAMRDLRGGRCDLDSAHDAGGVTRAALGVLDDDGEVRVAALGNLRRDGRKVEVVDGGDLAGDAVVVHGIDAVGGDLGLPGLVGTLAEVAFNGDAADGERFGHLAVAGGGRDEVANPIRLKFSLRKLLQEAHVAVEELLDVIDVVGHHGQPLDAHAEGEAAELFRVVADEAEDVGIDHARAEQFDPAALLAGTAALASAERAGDGDLDAGFGEGEKRRAEAGFDRRAEQRLHGVVERSLQVAEGDVGIDAEAFELMKDGRVRRVRRIVAVHLAGADDAHRRRNASPWCGSARARCGCAAAGGRAARAAPGWR